MTALRIGSLFSGIGGLELGLERGIGNAAHTVFQVEQNAYCRAVLAKHWPDALRFDDVRTVGAHNLPPVDVLCGGFPCQDISFAGLGAGLAGDRSGLWYEFARIIRELGPRYVVVENVAALLTRGLGDVLGTLASLGYDAWWDCLPAAAVGAPHRRDRVFLVAYPERERSATGTTHERSKGAVRHELRIGAGETTERLVLEPRTAGSGAILADSDSERGRCWTPRLEDAKDAGESSRRAEFGGWDVEPNVGRVANGVRSRVDRLTALGNAVVPQVAEVVGRLIAEREAQARAA